VVKPIVGIGGAVSDIGSGVAATFGSNHKGKDEHLMRWRQPRLLFATLGELRTFSDLEAELQRSLGPEKMQGILEVIALSREPGRCTSLLLFRSKLMIAEVVYDTTAQGTKPVALADSFYGKRLAKVFRPVAGSNDLQRELPLAECSTATWDPTAKALVLQEKSGSAKHIVPLEFAVLGEQSRISLVSVLQAAIVDAQKGGRSADWRALRAARIHEQGRLSSEPPVADVGGHHEVQVVEVQRRTIGNRWVAPYMPTDRHICWRWVDARGAKHPNLARGLQQEQCAAMETPPCELDSRFQPASDWEVQKSEHTDPEGWVYSLAWASSNWGKAAGCSDQLRKRLWVRQYE